ncbi:unnamed protein product [marine sediment metagenome]|uniref:Uncharacterized protein n=2 Tax=marine sediment metagenome TaxID=412755 RepID=X1RQJ2_9ZZZZ
MTQETRYPIPYSEAPDYFGFGNAAGYAEDFRTGAEGAYAKGEKWAKYWRSSKLDILVTFLQEGIFSIVTYPPAGFVIDDTAYIEKAERFRGWILQYRADPYGWAVLAATERIGIEEFTRLRKEYKQG